MIRDQKPTPSSALALALGEVMTSSDWCEFLTGFVFFWANQKRV
jgi:hypothetical protein